MKQAIITFSSAPEKLNGFGLLDYVENVISIVQAVEVLNNYYTDADMALITKIEIVTL